MRIVIKVISSIFALTSILLVLFLFKNQLTSGSVFSYSYYEKEISAKTSVTTKSDINNFDYVLFKRESCPYCNAFAPKLFLSSQYEDKKFLIIDTDTKETNPSTLWYINELEITEVPTIVNMKTKERFSYTDQIGSINNFLE